MPTYEYICQKCDHEFELSQSMKDDALTTCPKEKCGMKKWGKGKVKKQIGSGAGLIFKGSGFYITDYRSESYKEAAKKDVPPSASSSESSSAKSESKSESKGESKGESKAETKSGPKTETKPAKVETKPSKPEKK